MVTRPAQAARFDISSDRHWKVGSHSACCSLTTAGDQQEATEFLDSQDSLFMSSASALNAAESEPLSVSMTIAHLATTISGR